MAKQKYSPSGDLAKKADEQFSSFFGRKIKKAGKVPDPAAALPYRKPMTAIDAQFGPGDKIA